MYGRRTSRIKKITGKWGVFMSAMLKQKLIDIANGFTKYGLWKGGGSCGSSALSDMTDVTFTNLQAKDILKYNGSLWVNDKNLHEYSTEEKVVGKWIDGKNIYEKVINSGYLPNTSSISINVSTLNIDSIIQLKGITFTDDKLNQRPITLGTSDNNAIRIDFTNNNIRIFTWSNWSAYNSFIIIQYTKTTE